MTSTDIKGIALKIEANCKYHSRHDGLKNCLPVKPRNIIMASETVVTVFSGDLFTANASILKD